MPSPDVVEQLRGLGFRAAPEALRALLEHATKKRASPTEVCEQLAALERRERDGRNLARRTRRATLGGFAPLDRFDWSHPRSIDRGLYDELRSLAFVDAGHNVLLRGPSGVGKTSLAQNLGQTALEKGYTVQFTTLAGALADLLKQESIPALERRLRRYTGADLLIIDEIGYLPADSRSADLLYNVVSRRHEQRSTVITTNLPFKQWGTIFPGAACVAALVDRFVQHCHVLDIDADSWRQKESLEPPPPPAAGAGRRKRRR
jgi:DNA replication protein DnaC